MQSNYSNSKYLVPLIVLCLASLASLTYLRGAVGPTASSDGTYNLLTPRIDKTGALVVQPSGGKYGECSLRGLTYVAADQGSGAAPGTALGTTAFFALYNPAGNTFRFRIQKVRVAYVSGTLGLGVLYHCALKTTTQTAPSGGTALTNLCLDVGNGNVGTGVARTGGTVVQPVAIGPMCFFTVSDGTGVVFPPIWSEDLEGEIVVEPGCTYQLQAIAGAGTSPKLTASVTWTEEPIK